MTPLEAFEKLKNKPTLSTDWDKRKTAYDYNKLEYDIIETALKALEIIKETCVDVWTFWTCINLSDTDEEALKRYNKDRPSEYLIDKKEFDLLKEILK